MRGLYRVGFLVIIATLVLACGPTSKNTNPASNPVEVSYFAPSASVERDEQPTASAALVERELNLLDLH